MISLDEITTNKNKIRSTVVISLLVYISKLISIPRGMVTSGDFNRQFVIDTLNSDSFLEIKTFFF